MIVALIAILLLACGFAAWYIFYGLTCWFGGLGLGTPIPSHLLPFYGLWQDIVYLACPWKKTEHIRRWVDSGDGYMGDCTYQEIRDNNLYSKVAWKCLPGPGSFVFNHIAIPFGPCLSFLSWMSLAILVCVVLAPQPAAAGHCRVQVRQVVAHPVYAYPVQANVFYSVGEAARFEAILDKKLAALMQQQAKAPEVAQPATDAAAASLLATKCAKCHSGQAPKGGVIIDGVTPLDCDTALKAMRAVRDGEMPPKAPLNPDDAGVLFSELLDLSQTKE